MTRGSDALRPIARLARSGLIIGLLCALLFAACGGDGQSGSSDSSGRGPAPPANQRYGFSGDSVEIQWDPSADADTYTVLHATQPDADCQSAYAQAQAASDQSSTARAPGPSHGCVAIGTGLYSHGFTHFGPDIVSGERPYYWVVACNDRGCSPIDRDNPAQPPPPTPEQIRAVRDGSAVRISWDPVADASEYEVYLCDDGGWCERLGSFISEPSFVHQLPVLKPQGLTVIDRGDDSLSVRWLEVHGGSVDLRYQVAACNSVGCSRVGEGQRSAAVSYLEVGHYQLHRRTSQSQFAVVRDDLTLGQHVDEGLEPSTIYYYTVQYCNDAGCSPLSDETGGLTEAAGPVDPPPPPTGFRGEKIDVSGRGDDARVSWLTVDGATWYEVHQDSDGYSLDALISAPHTSHYDAQPNRGPLGTYWTTSYKVRACNKAGCSSFTDVVTLE